MAKPNYQFEKRQRDLEKKRKKEEKLQQKLAHKATTDGDGNVDAAADPAVATPDQTSETQSGA